MDKINLEFELVENEPEEGKPGEEKSPDEVPESPSKKKKKWYYINILKLYIY